MYIQTKYQNGCQLLNQQVRKYDKMQQLMPLSIFKNYEHFI